MTNERLRNLAEGLCDEALNLKDNINTVITLKTIGVLSREDVDSIMGLCNVIKGDVDAIVGIVSKEVR